MIRMYSKYERRTDTRTYEDRKKLYEGGWEVIRAESLDAIWKEKFDEWSKRPSKKLPKWFGERPGKKAGDAPWTPSGRRSSMSGPRGPPRSCPSGSARGPARRPEMLPGRHLEGEVR